jgi:hypothetical protein
VADVLAVAAFKVRYPRAAVVLPESDNRSIHATSLAALPGEPAPACRVAGSRTRRLSGVPSQRRIPQRLAEPGSPLRLGETRDSTRWR